MKSKDAVNKLAQLRESAAAGKSGAITVSVCCGTGCRASGALEVVSALESLLGQRGGNAVINTQATGCHGFCEQGPLMIIGPQSLFYCRVTAEDVAEIVEETIFGNRVVERLLYRDPAGGKRFLSQEEIPFYQKQERLIIGNNGKLVPTEIKSYVSLGGYSAMEKALREMSPRQVIEEIKASGLRGRGGGGFLTGLKWEAACLAEGSPKFVVCNADEGDPGCFQDRSILEGNPHSVLEGMIIGAFAVGAGHGYAYIRNEYPLALEHFHAAARQARQHGLLGKNILGSGFDFDVTVCRGGNAFVCGEETALLSSIEGITGEPSPRPRPPYPVERGLWGKPTVINNLKTWSTVPVIINRGAGWFAGIGTANSKGTMVFSLTGRVNHTGLVEVPMGLTLRELVFDIGGGIPGGKKFKALQIGGPAGGCLPEPMLDLPLDYEAISRAGSIIGSGGLIVMDESTCMVDIAKYFLAFSKDESCGKCTPCREGVRQMLHLLEEITAGRGETEHLAMIVELSTAMKEGSLCGLGRLAPNPILTTLQYFEGEYLAHVLDKRCPAGVCRELVSYCISSDKCNGCRRCVKLCPAGAITGRAKEPHVIDRAACTRCGACLEACRQGAVSRE